MTLENHFSTLTWKIFKTADGSYSLYSGHNAELMHNKHGAFSETLHVYEPVVEYVFSNEKILVPTFFSLGLGLAYVEMLIVAHAIQKKLKPHELKIDTFELDDELKNEFGLWLEGKECALPYLETARLFENHFQIEPGLIQRFLFSMKALQNFRIFGGYTPHTKLTNLYHGICYDAFSPKTNLELWSDNAFINIFNNCENNFCIFGTYASTGALKKILKKNNFTLQTQKGFGGKRESILAIKKPPSNEDGFLSPT